jgi:hypothetical protein
MHCFKVASVVCAFEDSQASTTMNLDNGSYVTLLLDGTRIGFCLEMAILIITHTFERIPHGVVSITYEGKKLKNNIFFIG